MFNDSFYPTPLSVLDQMGIDCYDKVCLEPSSGKGDIIDYLNKNGASQVLCCEYNKDLATISASKGQLIANDFFSVTSEMISHVNLIVMNPPFSNADKHIMHAWNIAPEGCEIIALCNWETINNDRGYSRKELAELISNYGESVNLKDCFSQAERTTNVQVGLVKLFKPVVTEGNGFDGFYLDYDSELQENAVIGFNEIKAVVNTYVAAVRCFDKVEAVAAELKAFTNVTFVGKQKEDKSYEKHLLSFGEGLTFKTSYSDSAGVITKSQFAKAFQKKCWNYIFDLVNIQKYVTKGVMEDINKFINNRKNYPFTVKNISKMLDIIVGTREQTMQKAIVEAVDNFTRHTHENRFGVEGWKTNDGHLLNKKFIVNYVAGYEFGNNLRVKTYNSHQVEYLIDLQKALCLITAIDFDTIAKVHQLKDLTANTWYEWGFFEFKVYKKGTGHFKFKDEKVWEMLNRAYARIKGQVLPEKFKSAA